MKPMSDETTRVLLVEDNPGDARLLREALLEAQAENITLLHVDCLRKAFARLQEKAFDLVLLDLSLPDATGLDTLVKMHAHSSQLAIVVLTGLDDETLAVTAVREGAQDYLIKGQVDGKLLVRAIRYAIARKRQEQSLRESKQLLERTLHSLRDAVLIVDSETLQIIDCSPAAVSMFGYAKEEIQGREISFLHVDDAAGKEFGKHLHEIVRQKGFLDCF
jgi:two-component system cell cycle sensor histidine kinase/response regulator CckA